MEGKYSGFYTFSETAQGFQIIQKELVKVLHNNGFIYKRPGIAWTPCVDKKEYFKKLVVINGRGRSLLYLLNKYCIRECENLLNRKFEKDKIKKIYRIP